MPPLNLSVEKVSKNTSVFADICLRADIEKSVTKKNQL